MGAGRGASVKKLGHCDLDVTILGCHKVHVRSATKSTGEGLNSGTRNDFLQHLVRLIFWIQFS